MNRLFNTLATAAGVVLLTGTFAAAQTAPAQTEKAPKAKSTSSQTAKAPKATTASGAIVKSDATSVTIKTSKGEESFAINNDTKITQGQKTLTTADLAAGEHATVSYTKSGDQMTATKISVAAKKATKGEKPAAKEPKAPAEKK